MNTDIFTKEALQDGKHITSLEIASVTGKQHKHVMEAIRKMEPAWKLERGSNFRLSQIQEKIPNGGYKLRPCYLLDKAESLFIATKFNDVARARLVLRWAELEKAHRGQSLCNPLRYSQQGQSPCAPKMLETEADILKRSDEILKREISAANESATGCFTMKQVARNLRMTYRDLCKLLEDHQVMTRVKGSYELLSPYSLMGYEAYRYHQAYRLDGDRRQRRYMVWTAEGLAFVRKFVKYLK